jgi:hypothetical protein
MRRSATAGIALAAIFGLTQCVRFTPENPSVRGDLVAPSDVKSLLRRGCYDCHSNETTWPWYSSVAPASWVVHHEVTDGRRHLNFSEWTEYASDPQTAAQKLREIAQFVRSGDMAPWYYRLFHSQGRLTPDQRDVLVRWAKQEITNYSIAD